MGGFSTGTSVVSIGSKGSVTTGSVVGGAVVVMGAEVEVVESIGSSGSVIVVFCGGWVVTEPDVDAAVVTGAEPLDAELLGAVVVGAELSRASPSLPAHVGGAPGEAGMLDIPDPTGAEVEVLSRTMLGGELESDGSGSAAVAAVEGAGLGGAGG